MLRLIKCTYGNRRPDAFGNVHSLLDDRGLHQYRDPGNYRGTHRRQDAVAYWPLMALLYHTPVRRFFRWIETDYRAARSEEV